MFVALIFILFITSSFAFPSFMDKSLSSDDRIVGGNATVIEEVPYIASLHFSGVHICGCIILNENFVLTGKKFR